VQGPPPTSRAAGTERKRVKAARRGAGDPADQTWRGGRVVDGGGLENHCTRKGTGGSNPSLSATLRSDLARRVPTVAFGEGGLIVCSIRGKPTSLRQSLATLAASVGRPRQRTAREGCLRRSASAQAALTCA